MKNSITLGCSHGSASRREIFLRRSYVISAKDTPLPRQGRGQGEGFVACAGSVREPLTLILSPSARGEADDGTPTPDTQPPTGCCLKKRGGHSKKAFSLLEVVIALGVITVGVVGVLAVFPAALQTGHSAQDETRAAHIAQSVFGSLVAQAPSQFSAVHLPVSDNATPTPAPIDLTASSSPTTPTLYGDNDGKLVSVQFATQNPSKAVYAIFIYTNITVPGFTDPASANAVTVRVAWPANAPATNQTFRDYVRIVSKY